MGQYAPKKKNQQKKKKAQDNRSTWKNKRGDSKVESNDSPEIQDVEETSDIPGPPSGLKVHEKRQQSK